jgi:plasmid stabilization system protein ParE
LLIERFPEGGHALGQNLRRLGVTRFRYVLIYRLKDDVAEVIAVAHERRHPRYWRSHLKVL